MQTPVVLLVPIKPLCLAKTRLRSSLATRLAAESYAPLVLAMALDTIEAAGRSAGVARVVAVTSDALVLREVLAAGIPAVHERGPTGLNEALVLGEKGVRESRDRLQLGALNADLPCLRPAELSSALRLAAGRRAFCRDRLGSGTTLLLGGLGEKLDPHFGPWSAAAHQASGAIEISGHLPSLRCDVDTASDLEIAMRLRVGRRTASVLRESGYDTSGDTSRLPGDGTGSAASTSA